MLRWKYPKDEAKRLAPLVLAYIGDAVFELYVRCYMATKEVKVKKLHRGTVEMVSAEAMAIFYREVEPYLNETELEVLHRGRNVKSRHNKRAGVSQYHMSTGFEALVGYLFLSDQEERLNELVDILIGDEHEGHEDNERVEAE